MSITTLPMPQLAAEAAVPALSRGFAVMIVAFLAALTAVVVVCRLRRRRVHVECDWAARADWDAHTWRCRTAQGPNSKLTGGLPGTSSMSAAGHAHRGTPASNLKKETPSASVLDSSAASPQRVTMSTSAASGVGDSAAPSSLLSRLSTLLRSGGAGASKASSHAEEPPLDLGDAFMQLHPSEVFERRWAEFWQRSGAQDSGATHTGGGCVPTTSAGSVAAATGAPSSPAQQRQFPSTPAGLGPARSAAPPGAEQSSGFATAPTPATAPAAGAARSTSAGVATNDTAQVLEGGSPTRGGRASAADPRTPSVTAAAPSSATPAPSQPQPPAVESCDWANELVLAALCSATLRTRCMDAARAAVEKQLRALEAKRVLRRACVQELRWECDTDEAAVDQAGVEADPATAGSRTATGNGHTTLLPAAPFSIRQLRILSAHHATVAAASSSETGAASGVEPAPAAAATSAGPLLLRRVILCAEVDVDLFPEAAAAAPPPFWPSTVAATAAAAGADGAFGLGFEVPSARRVLRWLRRVSVATRPESLSLALLHLLTLRPALWLLRVFVALAIWAAERLIFAPMRLLRREVRLFDVASSKAYLAVESAALKSRLAAQAGWHMVGGAAGAITGGGGPPGLYYGVASSAPPLAAGGGASGGVASSHHFPAGSAAAQLPRSSLRAVVAGELQLPWFGGRKRWLPFCVGVEDLRVQYAVMRVCIEVTQPDAPSVQFSAPGAAKILGGAPVGEGRAIAAKVRLQLLHRPHVSFDLRTTLGATTLSDHAAGSVASAGIAAAVGGAGGFVTTSSSAGPFSAGATVSSGGSSGAAQAPHKPQGRSNPRPPTAPSMNPTGGHGSGVSSRGVRAGAGDATHTAGQGAAGHRSGHHGGTTAVRPSTTTHALHDWGVIAVVVQWVLYMLMRRSVIFPRCVSFSQVIAPVATAGGAGGVASAGDAEIRGAAAANGGGL